MNEIELAEWVERMASDGFGKDATRIMVDPDKMTQREADIATQALQRRTGRNVVVFLGRLTTFNMS